MDNYIKSKSYIDKILNSVVLCESENPTLKEALELLFQGGKRLRPVISYEIAKAINQSHGTNYNLEKLILIGELIHSASLIIDDLPCMDNDITRRGLPTIHYKYGETSAHILTTYIFSLVYSLLNDNLKVLEEQNLKEITKREEIIFTSISDNLGIFGAPLGQYLDTCDLSIFQGDNSQIKDTITHLLEKKTATFFEISFILGFVASGGDLNHIDDLKLCAKSFGIAFQISDDFLDVEKDASKCFCPNFVNHMGKEQALITFNTCINLFTSKINLLGLANPVFDEIINLLKSRVQI